MTEAIFLLKDSETRKKDEISNYGGNIMLHDVNDEVIRKTRQYLDRFV